MVTMHQNGATVDYPPTVEDVAQLKAQDLLNSQIKSGTSYPGRLAVAAAFAVQHFGKEYEPYLTVSKEMTSLGDKASQAVAYGLYETLRSIMFRNLKVYNTILNDKMKAKNLPTASYYGG
jgi:hypothetical protein